MQICEHWLKYKKLAHNTKYISSHKDTAICPSEDTGEKLWRWFMWKAWDCTCSKHDDQRKKPETIKCTKMCKVHCSDLLIWSLRLGTCKREISSSLYLTADTRLSIPDPVTRHSTWSATSCPPDSEFNHFDWSLDLFHHSVRLRGWNLRITFYRRQWG